MTGVCFSQKRGNKGCMNRDIAHRRLLSWARGSASRCPTRSILELISNLTSELPYVSINNCGREIIFSMGASGLMCRAAPGHSPHRDRGPQRKALRQSPCRAPLVWNRDDSTDRGSRAGVSSRARDFCASSMAFSIDSWGALQSQTHNPSRQ